MKDIRGMSVWHLLVAALLLWGGYMLLSGSTTEKPKVVKATSTERKAPRETEVIQTIHINEREAIRVLSVPDPMVDDPMFDTRCLLYTNDRGTPAFHCLTRPQPSG